MDSPDSALSLLAASNLFHSLPAAMRRRATALVRDGGIGDAEISDDQLSIGAIVTDRMDFEVDLEFDTDLGQWTTFCEGVGCRPGRCVHVAAALSYYLEQLTLVPSTSTGAGKPAAKVALQPPPKAASTLLEAAAEAHMGRALKAEERRFVQVVRDIHRQCGNDGQISESSLWGLDWPGRIPSYSRIELFPGRPETELEFWFGLAELARQRKYPVPAFLQGLQPSDEYREKLLKVQRKREVARWMDTLRNLPPVTPGIEASQSEDLRFRLSRGDLIPETRLGEGPWRPVKTSRFQDFNQNGAARLNPQSAALWASFFPLATYHGTDFSEASSRMAHWLGLQLRLPAMASYFVDAAEAPIVRHETSLRWKVTQPDTEDGDYEFSLVDGDGQPAGTILAQFAGEPTLYLTSAGLFPGPGIMPKAVFPTKPTRVPAAVVESNAGLRLLDWTQAAPPPRLAEKIQTLPLQVSMTADLAHGAGGATEYCTLRVSAATSSGRFRTTLSVAGWSEPTRSPGSADELVRLDRTALAGISERVLDAGFRLDPFSRAFSLRVTKSFPTQFAEFLAQLPRSVDVKLLGELASLRDAAVSGTLRLQADDAGPDWFDLKVVVHVDDTTLTPEEISLLVGARGQWVRLGDRGWRRLDYQLTDQEEADLARIGLTPRQLSAEPQRLHAHPAARRFLPEETATAIERTAAELRARVTPDQPAAIRAELRPYQREGFHFLAYLTANRFGGVLADDMGLGKTLQTLTWLAWLRAEGAAPGRRSLPSLVVCPKSVQDNWRAEAERFCPDLRVRVWTGVTAADFDTALAAADLHVLNYAQLRAAEDLLQRSDFLAAILDEGQNIKNPSSQTTQVARQLRADHRLILTGTPIENRLMDLWSLMSFAMPGILGSRAGFNKLYDGKDDPFARARLAARVRPFLLRRTKAQVARDLPDRVEEDLYCELEGEQRALYRAELKTAQQHLLKLKTQSALNKDRFHLLSSLLRLRQICCHPRLLKPDAKQEGAKLDALLETLEPLMEEGEKVLVFSQFVELLSLLKPALAARKWTHWYLAGETENRGELVQRFQNHTGGGVFLISLKAGGAGLNLTAASYVILFDPWWNPAVENQAIDRTHRIGQTRKIMAYRLLIKDSIEEKIRSLQKSKHLLAEEVLGEERFSSALTLDDLRYLLAD